MTDEEVDTLADKLNAQYKLPPKSKSAGEGEDGTTTPSSVTPSATPSRDELVAPPPTANKDNVLKKTRLPRLLLQWPLPHEAQASHPLQLGGPAMHFSGLRII